MQRNCARCNSDKIARGVDLLDQGGVAQGPAEARVFGRGGLLFRNSVRGQVTLDVCGDCGHAEITVSNYREIFDAYLAAQNQKP